MTINIKAVDQLGNVAFIRQSDGGSWSCVLANGIPASIHYAGIGHGYETECAIALESAKTAQEALAIVQRYGSTRTTYTIFAPEAQSDPTPEPDKTIKPGFRVAQARDRYATFFVMGEEREFFTLDAAYANHINDALAAYEDDHHQWVEHDDYPVADWQYEVDNGDTRLGYSDWVQGKLDELAEPVVREYLVDVKLFASIRVKATSEADARQMLKDHIDSAEANLGAWPSGDPIVCEVSLDDPANDELVEIDGEAV